MAHLQELKEKTQKRVKTGKKTFGTLGEDLVASTQNGLYFLTGIFKNGYLLGFWSHSSWGNVHDQEQGWVILSPKLDVVSSCETRTMGGSAGNDFKKWRNNQKENYGKLTKFADEFSNESFWRIKDC